MLTFLICHPFFPDKSKVRPRLSSEVDMEASPASTVLFTYIGVEFLVHLHAAAPSPAGHCALVPVHFSVASHLETDGLQTFPAATKLSLEQEELLPEQYSATSQSPAAGLQTEVEGENEFAGQ